MKTPWNIAAATALVVAVAISSAGIGYYIGRESVKNELRASLGASLPAISIPAHSEPDHPAPVVPAPAVAPETSPIEAILLDKGFHEASNHGDDFQSAILITLSFHNASKKDIRAFDGVIQFEDLLGNSMLSVKLTHDDPLNAGATVKWAGNINYNQFLESHANLRNANTANLKTEFFVRKVLFSDGTEKTFQK